MPTHQEIQKVVDAYVETFEVGDPEIAVSLYAEDANIQDPIGTDTLQGIEAIRAFYTMAVGLKVKVKMRGPVRSSGNHAAFPFSIVRKDDGVQFDVIDTFKFNDEGKIVEMRAYWSEANLRPIDPE